MGEEEREDQRAPETGCGGEGFSILLSEEKMYSFMEDGDFSSSRELEHFNTVAAGLEKRMAERSGFSLLALSMGEKRISRDFSVLQIAHLLARHGKRILIVDCDFLSPGLSGLVTEIESHGFLDLLLYGSSLRSVMRDTGIENVWVTGPGSFPVSRTIPFALKEFGKIRDFLSKNCDVVIYCSTLYTDDGSVNPLAGLVDGLLMCCRIDEMKEGELEERLGELGERAPDKDLICFCDSAGGERAGAGADLVREPEGGDAEMEEEIIDLDPGSEIPPGPDEEESLQPAFIEKSDEIDAIRREKKGGANLVRIVTISVITVVVAFLVWWFMTERSIRRQEGEDRMTELVARQQDAREDAARTVPSDSAAEGTSGEDAGDEGVSAPGASPGDETVTGESEEPGTSPAEVEGDGGMDEAETPAEGGPEDRAAEDRKMTYAPEGMYFGVHVASFQEISRAGTEAEYFESRGREVRVSEVTVNDEIWYRVYVGEFETKEEADDLRQELLGTGRIAYARVVKLSYQGRDGS